MQAQQRQQQQQKKRNHNVHHFFYLAFGLANESNYLPFSNEENIKHSYYLLYSYNIMYYIPIPIINGEGRVIPSLC